MDPKHDMSSACGCCLSRRRFLSTSCGACAAAVAPGLLPRRSPAAEAPPQTPRPRVRLVFSCFTLKQDRPTWPHIGYDFAPDLERVTATLRQRCPQVEFVPAVAHGPEDAQKLLGAGDAEQIDGYIVYQMNNWVRVMQTIVASGKPTLVADFPYAGSGGFLVFTAGLRRTHQNFSVVASADLEDLAASAQCFEVLKRGGTTAEFVAACDRVRRQRTAQPSSGAVQPDPVQLADIGSCLAALKRSKLLTVGGQMHNLAKEIQTRLGIQVIGVPFPEMAAAYEQTDREQARQLAARWQAAARSVTIEDAASTLGSPCGTWRAGRATSPIRCWTPPSARSSTRTAWPRPKPSVRLGPPIRSRF